MESYILFSHLTEHTKSIKLKVLNEFSKSIFKINIFNTVGTGFFAKILKNNKNLMHFLVSSNLLILIEFISEKKEIEIIKENQNIKLNIILDEKERNIISLKDEGI